MSEQQEIKRNIKGRFVPGPEPSLPRQNSSARSIRSICNSLRNAFYTQAQCGDLVAVYMSHLDLCLNCPDPKTRLAAIELYESRFLGKVKEEVEVSQVQRGTPDEAMYKLRQMMNAVSEPVTIIGVKEPELIANE